MIFTLFLLLYLTISLTVAVYYALTWRSEAFNEPATEDPMALLIGILWPLLLLFMAFSSIVNTIERWYV